MGSKGSARSWRASTGSSASSRSRSPNTHRSIRRRATDVRTFATVVVGAGPAGLLAALALARHQQPLLLARRPARARAPTVEAAPAAALPLLLPYGGGTRATRAAPEHLAQVAAWGGAAPRAQL